MRREATASAVPTLSPHAGPDNLNARKTRRMSKQARTQQVRGRSAPGGCKGPLIGGLEWGTEEADFSC